LAHRVVIVGGGFGGLSVAKNLRGAAVEVTLVDRRNFHLFQPLLYQVATGALSPADIAAPLRAVLRRQRNVRVLLGDVTGIDTARRQVQLRDGSCEYDTLVVATGSHHQYFGHDAWAARAPGLKTVEDATHIRSRILGAFEAAERAGASDLETVRACLTFVIVGGGPTGVEMAGAVAEIAHDTLAHDFRAIDPSETRILLVEAADRILTTFPDRLSASAARALERLGVTVHTGARVTEIGSDAVDIHLDGRVQRIPTRTVIWAAGVQASSLGRVLADATGVALDRAGRVVVEPDTSLAGHPEIFVIGDLACYTHQNGTPLPGVAQVAIQQGRYVARLIAARLRGETRPPFRYRDLGNLATIGRAAAVADFGRVRLDGFPAWFVWVFVHLMHLVDFENRVLVFMQWVWSYITRNRAARLITNGTPPSGR
jgi:NADH dehydrogenase